MESIVTKFKKSIVASLVATLLIIGIIFSINPAAIAGTLLIPASEIPATVYTGSENAGASGSKIEQLRQRARTHGEIRVIVELRFNFRAAEKLSHIEAIKQKRALRRAQSDLAGRIFGDANAQSADRFDFIPFMSIFVNSDQLERLLIDPMVVNIQEDVMAAPLLADSGRIVHAPDLWEKNIAGTNQVIAILDTGIDKTHPMLAGKIVSEACYSTTKGGVDPISSFCPNGVNASTKPGAAKYCPLSIPGCEHGTHVSGIAAGNGPRIDGVARGSKIIAIQVFSRAKNNATNKPVPLSYGTDQVKALQRVYELRNKYKIAAVNMSLGGGAYTDACDADFPALTTAMTRLRDAGIATIIASGNAGYLDAISEPACISVALPIGNTQKNDFLFGGPNTQLPNGGSNHSDQIRLLAPGTNITSAIPGNKYREMTGTSMAAPHVAGAFALLRQAKPDATIEEMAEALRCSGKPINRVFISGTGNGAGLFALEPYRRRIDLIGAYNNLTNKANLQRTWSFSKGSEILDWAKLFGKWTIKAGNLLPVPPRGRGVGIEVSTCLNNVEVVVRVKRDEEKTMSGFMPETGIVVRSQSSFQTMLTSGYAAVYRRCKANATGHCDDTVNGPWGLAEFYRFDQQKALDGFPVRKSLCRKSSPINVGGYNTIKVVSNGANHNFYLNGNLVCSVNDTTYLDGDLMLYGAPAPLDVHGLKFDSVSVKVIAPNAPPKR